jgi:hypothetical protein
MLCNLFLNCFPGKLSFSLKKKEQCELFSPYFWRNLNSYAFRVSRNLHKIFACLIREIDAAFFLHAILLWIDSVDRGTKFTIKRFYRKVFVLN